MRKEELNILGTKERSYNKMVKRMAEECADDLLDGLFYKAKKALMYIDAEWDFGIKIVFKNAEGHYEKFSRRTDNFKEFDKFRKSLSECIAKAEQEQETA